jgi:hypothetical protein
MEGARKAAEHSTTRQSNNSVRLPGIPAPAPEHCYGCVDWFRYDEGADATVRSRSVSQ